MYQIDNEKFATAQDVLTYLELLPSAALPSNVEAVADVMPAHDPHWQECYWDYNTDGTVNGMAVRDRIQYARVDHAMVVQELSLSSAAGWLPVPPALNRHIRAGWHYSDDLETFLPPSVESLRQQMQDGAVAMAEEARQAIAQPAGVTEAGAWAINYTNVALHLAGLPTPLWETALQIEASQTSETVADLRAVHIQRAGDFHAIAALTQGMKRGAKAAFAASDSVELLLSEADALRANAAAALADPAAVIAAIAQGD